MTTYEHFHEGEVAMHADWGTDTEAYERQSRQMMRPEVNPHEHVFIEELSFSMAGTIDAQGRPWASPLLSGGDPLFRVTSPTTISIDALPIDGDPMRANIADNAELGVLFFSMETRRRAKSIGQASITENDSIDYRMTRLFGICPKYIFKRLHQPAPQTPALAPETRSALTNEDRLQLQRSDTAFFASFSPHGADVTHRGGSPGFIEVVSPDELEIPDYFGNGMYNTLGNLRLDDRLGLTAVDFTTGRNLQLTGRATVRSTGLSLPEPERSVSLKIDDVKVSWASVGQWVDVEPSRYSPKI